MHFTRQANRQLTLASLLAALALSSAPLASASTPTVMTCTGYGTQTHTPGLTLVTQPTSITGSSLIGPCLGSDLVDSGTTSGTATAQASCLIGLTSTTTSTITWKKNGEVVGTSKFTAQNVTTRTLGQTIAVSDGTITEGLFNGAHARRVITFVTFDLAGCVGTGISSIAGPLELVVTGI
ncbi:hypothetical protein [Streptomyces cyaneofuscatus]|uniref:hypothetical protein n=1 Tax=Streptomyces cyaneofuscatus TaxID=66883 RepID=UPI00365C5166